MPLMIMSPNMAERGSPSRKRSHEEYSEGVAPKVEPQADMKMEPSEMGRCTLSVKFYPSLEH